MRSKKNSHPQIRGLLISLVFFTELPLKTVKQSHKNFSEYKGSRNHGYKTQEKQHLRKKISTGQNHSWAHRQNIKMFANWIQQVRSSPGMWEWFAIIKSIKVIHYMNKNLKTHMVISGEKGDSAKFNTFTWLNILLIRIEGYFISLKNFICQKTTVPIIFNLNCWMCCFYDGNK